MQPGNFPAAQFKAILDETIANIRLLEHVKGGEYAGDGDRLANFRRNARRMNLVMEQVWGVYAGKHWDSICQFISDLETGVERPRGEPLESRCDDLIVYLILFKAMLYERKHGIKE